MALFWNTATQNGTANNDILVGHPIQGPAHTQNGSSGNDLVYGDFPAFTSAYGDTSGTALDLSSNPNLWNTSGNPDVRFPSIPHAAVVYTDTVAESAIWYKVTVAAGATITIDVDHGADDVGGGEVDTIARLYGPDATTVLATALNTPSGLEATTLVSADDPFITHTFAAAGTYFIRIGPEDGSNFTVGDAFMLYVSLTGQPTGIGDPVPGNDIMHGNDGNDVLYGLFGADEMFGDAGDDRLFGGSGADLMSGGDGDDIISGGVEDDIVQGGNDDDKLRGGSGVNQVFGGDGADQLFVGVDAAGSTLDGGPGTDFIMIEGNKPLYDLTVLNISNIEGIVFDDIQTLQAGGTTRTGATTIRVTAEQLGFGVGLQGIYGSLGLLVGSGTVFPERLEIIMGDSPFLSLSNAEFQFIGHPDDKIVIIGDATAEEIYGGEINDEIGGGGGDDSLTGLDGDDLLDGGEGADDMEGGEGDDIYVVDNVGDQVNESTGTGADTVRSSISFNLVSPQVQGEIEFLTLVGAGAIDGTGNIQDNTITGNGVANVLRGMEGADTLLGGLGDDILIGGEGIDTFDGGGGVDTVSYEDSVFKVHASLSDPATNKGSAEAESYVSVENLTGTAKGDRLTGDANTNVLGGRAGNDKLFGLSGTDLLEGRDGKDLLVGGKGADELRGGNGKDTASYQTANKGVVASLAKPTVNTREAKGDIYAGIENLTGSSKADTLTGKNGANVLKGLDGGDTLNGGKGGDKLVGADGNDILKGGQGSDKLAGGVGRDQLTGGTGGDAFQYRTLKDSSVSSKGRDTIGDFKRGQGDKIDLRAIDARKGTKKNDKFTFIKDDGFSNVRGELRYEKKGDKTFVYGDVNGDGKADFAIQIAKAMDLAKGDFLL